ncbi:MAG: ATP-dependent Clp protease ATP-binding subunit, partial [Candidatus Moranbacteria bacterium]|nr:ATP-dependent Clp protease ATP-binding subunit [Candidatus Moranbacteria bacterium]
SELTQLSKIGFDAKDNSMTKQRKITREAIQKEISQNLSGELLNRLDNLLIFDYLNKKNLQKIAKSELQELTRRLKERKIKLAFTNSVQDLIAQKSINPQQGARLIKKQIEKIIEPLVAQKIIEKNPKKINLKVKNKKIVIS